MPLFRHPTFACLTTALLLSATGCPGCQVEKLQPGAVANGIARLTIRHSATITSILSSDTRCGFASPQVLANPLIQGQPGQRGAVTWTVERCDFDWTEPTLVTRDCVPSTGSATGSISVNATRRVVGTITGDPENPVIPETADSAFMHFDVTFDDFKITRSDSAAWLHNLSGVLHYDVTPYLAMSKSLGVCAVATMDLAWSNLRYENAAVVIETGDRQFPAVIASSDFDAMMGRWKDQENSISGELTVWDSLQTLPADGDQDGLDPDYTEQYYLDSISCNEDLIVPVRYDCPSLKEQLVQGAARLTIAQLGTLAGMAISDARCGFASPAVLGSPRLVGTVGGPGKATFTIASPCTINFPTKTSLGKDCNGLETFAQGAVTVTGTQVMSGVLSGSASTPVVPSSRDPVEVSLTATFSDFVLTDSAGGPSLKAASGTLRGTVLPRLGIDPETSICSKTTSIAEFRDVEWRDARLLLGMGDFTFEVNISYSNLAAQSGTKGGRTNYLAGILISEGVPITMPPAGASPILDPEYDPAKFQASFSCGGFQMPETDEQCSFDWVLAINSARLAMANAGALAGLINSNSLCGFESTSVLINPTRVEGDTGEFGLLAWAVSRCRVGQVGIASSGADCDGVTSYASGYAEVSAERIVTGERDTQYVLADSIIPRTPDAVTITLTDSQLTDFTAFSLAPGATTPEARLLIHSGRLIGSVQPMVGERASKPGVFDVPTPVAKFSSLKLIDVYGTLEVGGMAFNVSIPNATLNAQNGSLKGVSNTISGSVVLGNGSTITIPPSPLNPSFSQAAFDHSYACTADLKQTIPPN